MSGAEGGAWLEWRVTVPLELEELAAESLLRPPFTGVEVVGGGVVRTFARAELLDGAARAELDAEARAFGATAVEWRPYEDRDWEAAARATWRTFRVGRLCVGPDGAAPRPDDVPLRLEPGGAYGTGRHPSTRGGLLGVQRFLAAGETIVDAGCGSGILAVAALLLGAREAVAFDIDPNAGAATRDLASANGVDERLAYREGGFETVADVEGVDGVAANLYYDLVERHAPDLARLLRPGGWFVVAGIRASLETPVRDAVAAAGLDVTWRWPRGRWVAFGGRKGGS
ncbi:MAG: 50S ribosomal protein L11 methyltransferase [Planctomycetota bacterium JB042]